MNSRLACPRTPPMGLAGAPTEQGRTCEIRSKTRSNVDLLAERSTNAERARSFIPHRAWGPQGWRGCVAQAYWWVKNSPTLRLVGEKFTHRRIK